MDKKKIAKSSLIAVAAVAVTGLAFATPSLATPAKQTTIGNFQEKGKGHDNGQGMGAKPADVSQNVTVTVPDDGGTYKLVITETAPPAAANSTSSKPKAMGLQRNHTFVVPVTGTGSVTVAVPGLHPGTYSVDLVKVSSTQELTVPAPTTSN